MTGELEGFAKAGRHRATLATIAPRWVVARKRKNRGEARGIREVGDEPPRNALVVGQLASVQGRPALPRIRTAQSAARGGANHTCAMHVPLYWPTKCSTWHGPCHPKHGNFAARYDAKPTLAANQPCTSHETCSNQGWSPLEYRADAICTECLPHLRRQASLVLGCICLYKPQPYAPHATTKTLATAQSAQHDRTCEGGPPTR